MLFTAAFQPAGVTFSVKVNYPKTTYITKELQLKNKPEECVRLPDRLKSNDMQLQEQLLRSICDFRPERKLHAH